MEAWARLVTYVYLSDDPPIMPEDCATEMRTNTCHSLLTATQRGGIEQLIDCTHYSELQRLLRVTAIVKKFAAQFQVLVKRNNILIDWTVSAADIASAEMDWIRVCQKQLDNEPKFELWKNQLDIRIMFGDVVAN